MAMAISSMSFGLVVGLAFTSTILLPSAHAQVPVPAPSPTSDGTSIDQGIAYVLMAVALVLTYLIHAADLSLS